MYKKFKYKTEWKQRRQQNDGIPAEWQQYVCRIKVWVTGYTINIEIYRNLTDKSDFSVLLLGRAGFTHVTIDTKSGYTTYIPETTVYKGREIMKHSGSGVISKAAYRAGYYCGSFKMNLPQDAREYIAVQVRRLTAACSRNIPEDKKIAQSFDDIVLYTLYPQATVERYRRLMNWGKWQHYVKPPVSDDGIMVISDAASSVREQFEQSGIPNVKSLKRPAYLIPEDIPLLESISQSFKNVDLIRAIYYAYIGAMPLVRGVYIDFSAEVFKEMIRHKGERIIAAKLISFLGSDRDNYAYMVLHDIIRSYDTLQQCEFNFSGNYSIDELHYALTMAITKQETVNREISYTNKEQAFALSDGVYSLMPAKDTYQLIEVGAVIKICVGSYSDRAVNKQCSIFILWDMAVSNPVGCIELHGDKHGYKIVQAKGMYNQLLSGQPLEFVMSWAAQSGLSIETRDLPQPPRQRLTRGA